MAKVTMETKLPVPADKLWQTIGGCNSLPDWHPGATKSEVSGEGKGSTRTVTLPNGASLIERLENSNPANRLYSYSIVSGPLPVADYLAELRVKDNGDGTSTVEWSSDFQPKGVPEGDAAKAVRGIYQAGFDNLKKMFGG